MSWHGLTVSIPNTASVLCDRCCVYQKSYFGTPAKKTVLPKIRAACATISRTAIYASCMVKS